jgi:hypothetical protein
MSESVVTATVDIKPAAVSLQESAAQRRARGGFYVGMSGALLLIVLIGFTRTLYLRAFFDVPEIPASVFVHGIVLTAWFVGFFLQTTLVAIRRTDIHRQLGRIVGGVGVAVFAVSMAVTFNFVARQKALGVDIEARIRGLSVIVWSDLAALLAFAIFLSAAIAVRRRPEMHKRLMLLSSISIVQPAMSRMWRWPVFDGLDPLLLGLGGLLSLILALGVYDLVVRKRVHAVTLCGGSFFMGCKIIGIYVIASSEAGLSFVRGLG